MKLGVAISEDLPLGTLKEIAGQVESAGLDSIWVNDGSGRDPFLVCQSWAEATSRLELGIGVASIWTRTPAQLASMSATLQEASGGRFILGLGVSHPKKMGTGHGVEVRRPVDAMREVLTIISQADNGEPTNVDGVVFSSHGFELEIEPRPPMSRRYIAAMGPKMINLAGTHSDGVLLNWMSPENIAAAASQVQEASADVRRTVRSVEIAAYVRLVVARERAKAREALAVELMRFVDRPAYMSNFERQGHWAAMSGASALHQSGATPEAVANHLGDDLLSQYGWFGSEEDDPTDAIRAHEAAGLQHLVARVLVVDSTPVDTIHTLVGRMRLAVR